MRAWEGGRKEGKVNASLKLFLRSLNVEGVEVEENELETFEHGVSRLLTRKDSQSLKIVSDL